MSRLYPSQPIVGVGIVIFNKQNILLIRRGKNPRKGEWSLPGGAQELGETIFEAAKRETKEETNLEIKVLGLLDVINSIHKDDKGRIKQHYTLIDVYASVISGKPIAGDDADAVSWFNINNINSLNLWSETERIIHKGYKLWKNI